MLISDTFFTGKENLAIRVIADTFGSDPDIFISKVSASGYIRSGGLLKSLVINLQN